MAELIEVKVPDIGAIDNVTVVEVLVAVGDKVATEAPLITLESDKASMEVPSPQEGVVKEIKVKAGDKVGENALILMLEVEGSAAAEAPAPAKEPAPAAEPAPATEPSPAPASEAPAPVPEAPVTEASSVAPSLSSDSGDEGFDDAYAGPGVRKLARELGVELGRVTGSGRKGRITPEDLKGWVKTALATGSGSSGGGVAGFTWPQMPTIDFAKFGPVEVVPLGRIRKLSAANLHRSWLHVPHVTQFEDADITELENFRKEQNEQQSQKRGVKLTPLAMVMKAVASALAAYPDFNSSLDATGENLIVKSYHHLGVAVETPNGLVVPVIRDVDQKGLWAIAKELGEKSAAAREGKLAPKDFQGASFTISSLGGIGGTAFTPIVNAPEVGILGVSRSSLKPVWQDGGFVPRLMLPLSLSYDHRVIDGAYACRFIVHLAGLLADLRKLLF